MHIASFRLVGLLKITVVLFGYLPVLLLAHNPKDSPFLNIAVSANFTPAMQKLARLYEKNEGVSLKLISGSSGKLYHQILSGLPVDLFISADTRYVQQLVNQQYIAKQSHAIYAIGKLVLLVNHKQFMPNIDQTDVASYLAYLSKYKKNVGLANPATAPYGLAAKQVLNKYHFWPCKPIRCVMADNAARVYHFLHLSAVDAAFVARSLVPSVVPDHLKVIPILDADYSPIMQSAGVLVRTKKPEAANKLLTFLLSADAQKIIRQYGYTVRHD